MARNNKIELDKYSEIQKTLESQLKTSKTAYTPNVKPSMSDLQTQLDLKEIKLQRDKASSDYQKARWYPERDPKEPGVGENKENVLMRGIHGLSAPLYGIVGGVEAMLGKGTESGLSNIWANIKERGVFGDILRSYNMPTVASMPLGLALDIAFDPIAWATLGASATIPRVAYGLSQKGLTGAAKGVSSSALKKAASVGRVIPGVDTAKLTEKAAVAARQYDTLVGRSVDNILGKRAEKIKWGEQTEEFLKKSEWGNALITGFKYSNQDWMQAARLDDAFEVLKGTDPVDIEKIKGAIRMIGATTGKVDDVATRVRNTLLSSIDEGADIATRNSKIADKFTASDVTGAMAGEATTDKLVKDVMVVLREEMDKMIGKTGTDWYDKVVESFKNIKVGDKKVGYNTLKEYDRFIKLFKIAKIGGNISAYTNATVGNLTMGLMAGLNITRPGYFGNVKGAWNILNGKVDEKFLEKILKNDEWVHYIDSAPSTFPKTYGTTRGELRSIELFGRPKKKTIHKAGEGADAKVVGETVEDIGKKTDVKSDIVSLNLSNDVNKLPSTFIGDEIYEQSSFGGYFPEWLRKIEKAGDKSTGARFLHWYLTQPMNKYQRIDAAYKLGTAVQLTNVGMTERELLTLSRAIRIAPDEITYVPKEHLWKLSPDKATEVVNEIYMNYGAMPAAVKVLRSMPVFGAPFACRTVDTEILTKRGWKHYTELNIGEDVASYNMEKKTMEWKILENVFEYDYDGELYNINGRSINISATPNHDCIVAKKENIELGIKNGKRKRGYGKWIVKKIKTDGIERLGERWSIVTGAEHGYDGINKKIISDDIVELVGWFVTEGSYVSKRKDGDFSSFVLTQARPGGVDRIKKLRKRLCVTNSVQIQKKENVKMANYDCYQFYFGTKYREIMRKFAPDKKLTIDFLNKLTREQLRLLFDILILADGSINKDGRIVFIQNYNETLDTFQVLCLMLGYSVTILKRDNKCCTVNVNIRCYRQIKRSKITKIKYKNKVWCPQVSDNSTWVARVDKKYIDLTGNSFMYGMAVKTGKTVINNPAAFNKMTFLMSEFSGRKSPLEKYALESPYHEWYNRNGMIKLPFFEDHPVYANVANMVPYYTMNMFQPSERRYENTLSSGVAAAMDKLPFFKTPEGQVMFDYFIQPAILRESNPRGMFDQQLWPNDASGLEKMGYAGRTMAEAVIPPSAGVAGLATPEAALKYVPSFRWRQVGMAKEGKTPIGATGYEPATQRTMRTLMSMMGVPMYPLNIEYTSKELKKKLKK